MKIDYLIHRIASRAMNKEFATRFEKTQERRADYKYTMRNMKRKRVALESLSSDSEKYKEKSKTRFKRVYRKKQHKL